MNPPLSERMRPQNLEDYLGQNQIVGEDTLLFKAIHQQQISSMIFWGPPGVGKTSLARIIAQSVKLPFIELSAINAGVKDIREAIAKAEDKNLFTRKSHILFIDEIHRFSKSQQDALLGAVERGTITLIGATTENPSFEVIPALLSRCKLLVLEHLTEKDMVALLHRAINNDEHLKVLDIELVESEALIKQSGGDARRLLNGLESTVLYLADAHSKIVIDNKTVANLFDESPSMYDKGGEMHYDVISAFIKSVRGSHPDAALYYLARMLQGGEQVKFIARRLLILATEDIGLANPNAMLMANQCMETVHKLGMPEARIPLSMCTIYLANSRKSNSAYKAIDKALAYVNENPNQPVPLHLRNAPTKLMKDLDYGKEYKYPHDFPGNFYNQPYFPKDAQGQVFYHPSNNPTEENFRQLNEKMWGNNDT